MCGLLSTRTHCLSFKARSRMLTESLPAERTRPPKPNSLLIRPVARLGQRLRGHCSGANRVGVTGDPGVIEWESDATGDGVAPVNGGASIEE